MLNAVDDCGFPVDPAPGLHALCPECRHEVQSKVGRIVIPHFAHLAGQKECEEWEPESHWHRSWKLKVPRENREVVLQSRPEGMERIGDILPRVVESFPTVVKQGLAKTHRADIVTWDGMILELQKSNLAPETIEAREEFYRYAPLPIHLRRESEDYMAWLFDVEEPYQYDRLLLRPGKNGPQDPYRTFRWKHARKHIAFTTVPTYLDLGILAGPLSIFELRKLHTTSPVGGYGFLIDREKFIQQVVWPEGFSHLPLPTDRNCPDHPTYPLVRKGLADFCRRGRHYPDRPGRKVEQASVLERPEGCPLCGVAWSTPWPGKPRRCLRGHSE